MLPIASSSLHLNIPEYTNGVYSNTASVKSLRIRLVWLLFKRRMEWLGEHECTIEEKKQNQRTVRIRQVAFTFFFICYLRTVFGIECHPLLNIHKVVLAVHNTLQ